MAFLNHQKSLSGSWWGNAQPLSDQQISTTISYARILLIVGLVFLHYESYPNSSASPFDGMDINHHPLATYVNSFVLFFFFSVVPVLSVISGWLFFNLPVEDAALTLRRRIGRRFSSLYLPLIFWNALFLGLLALFHAAQPDSLLFEQINIHFETAGLFDYINAIFGVTQHPVAFQFWFVRDLFVTALISPLLWVMLKHAPWLGLAILGFAWIIGSHLIIFFRTDVVLFFYIGGLLRMRRTPLTISLPATLLLLGSYLVLVGLRAAAPALVDMSAHRPEWLTGATRAMRLVGVPACWGVFLHLAQRKSGEVIARYGGLAFFLHAAHFPLLAAVKLALWRWVPAETGGWMLIHYLVSVVVTVLLGLSAGLLLIRVAPRWFALMNGGRLIPLRSRPPQTRRLVAAGSADASPDQAR